MTKPLARRIEDEVESRVDDLVHDLRRTRKAVAEEAEDALAAVSHFADEAGRQGEALAKTASKTVRARPFASLAIAASIATVLGFVLGRVSPRKG